MKQIILILGMITFLISFVSASICPEGVYPCNPNVNFQNPKVKTVSFDNNSGTINSSNYWGNYYYGDYDLILAEPFWYYNMTTPFTNWLSTFVYNYNQSTPAIAEINKSFNQSLTDGIYAKYNFTNNNFNGSGNFTTTGRINTNSANVTSGNIFSPVFTTTFNYGSGLPLAGLDFRTSSGTGSLTFTSNATPVQIGSMQYSTGGMIWTVSVGGLTFNSNAGSLSFQTVSSADNLSFSTASSFVKFFSAVSTPKEIQYATNISLGTNVAGTLTNKWTISGVQDNFNLRNSSGSSVFEINQSGIIVSNITFGQVLSLIPRTGAITCGVSLNNSFASNNSGIYACGVSGVAVKIA